MKNSFRFKTLLSAAAITLALSTALTACSGEKTSTDSDKASTAKTTSTEVSGTITAMGSSALQPLVDAAAQNFMSKNKKATIQVQAGGSGTGLTQVSQGGCDIGNSDIFAEEKLSADQAKALTDNKVCVVGFSAIVNPNVTVTNLTKKQLADVFTGKVKNWKEVGGSDIDIVIVNRPTTSGTRAVFKKYALDGAEEAQGQALTEDNSGTVLKTVADTKGAISYLAFSYINDSVKKVSLDGVEPTIDNVTSGKYPIWSYEHMYTKGAPQGLTKAFIEYMTSNDVQGSLVSQKGYIPVSNMKVSR